MTRLRILLSRLRGLFGKTRAERELEVEIQFHLEREIEKNIALGLPPVEARRQARVSFGAMESIKEDHRDGRGVRWLEEFIADVRYAFRGLRRNPLLGAAAILTLAIGIGANTAIYSAVNAVVLRPLPFADPGRLVMLWEENPEKGWHRNIVAPANYLDWKEQAAGFRDVAAYFAYPNSLTLTGAGEPRVLATYGVTGNFFSVLGVRPQLGTAFTDTDTWTPSRPAVIISHRLWEEQFGAAGDIVGKTIRLDMRDFQVLGVMPASFRFPDAQADVWFATGWAPASRAQVSFRRAHGYRAIARLKPGVSLAEANAKLQIVVERLKRQYPATNKYMGAGMTPLQEFLIGDTRQALLLLLGAVGLLLLIACANVGNLMLIQAAGRGRESALRLALGARRSRLLRQALTESLVLSALGGAAGLALGWWGTRILFAMQPGMLPVQDIAMDGRVLEYVIAITVGSGIVFGVAPILWINQRMPGEVLKDGMRGVGLGGRMQSWGRALVVCEVALALLLSVGAGLLVRSFQQLQRVNPGFDPDGVLAISMAISDARYDSAAKISGFYGELLDRINAIPDVRSSGLSTSLPLGGGVGWTSDFTAAGRGPDGYGSEVAHRAVSPDYFRTMHVPLKAGRTFTEADNPGSERVVVINDALARTYFRGQNPIGQRIAFDKIPDSTTTWRTIVGVVGNERQSALDTETQIEIMTPEKQAPSTYMNVMIRTPRDPVTLVPAIRRVVAGIDPTIAFNSAQTMNSVRDQSLARARFLMRLLFGFAGAGVLLAAVGVYGVMAHVARGRTREMGIRIALGAQAGGVRWLVVREGLTLTALGVGIGVAGALVACRAMTAILYHVAPADPVTFVVVPATLAATAFFATWLPAARASRADPMASLRID